MPYITNTDIQTRLGASAYVQLTDDAGTGNANEAVVDEARLGAEGQLDAYLARRYAVPIDLTQHAELSGLLRSIALDLAEHRLRLRRPPIPQEATSRRDAAVTWLLQVALGQINLPAVTTPATSPLGDITPRVTGAERVFTRDELSGF